MELLKLAALDAEDLAIISAHLQDAVVRLEDAACLRDERRFALVVRRFDWEALDDEPPRRRLAGLHFERVVGVRSRGVDRDRRGPPLNLLAITFEETDAPSGVVTLHFSEGAAIRLDVECIEAQMKDLGPIWEAEGRPIHPVEEAASIR